MCEHTSFYQKTSLHSSFSLSLFCSSRQFFSSSCYVYFCALFICSFSFPSSLILNISKRWDISAQTNRSKIYRNSGLVSLLVSPRHVCAWIHLDILSPLSPHSLSLFSFILMIPLDSSCSCKKSQRDKFRLCLLNKKKRQPGRPSVDTRCTMCFAVLRIFSLSSLLFSLSSPLFPLSSLILNVMFWNACKMIERRKRTTQNANRTVFLLSMRRVALCSSKDRISTTPVLD